MTSPDNLTGVASPLAQALAANAGNSRRLEVIDVGCRWGASEQWAPLGRLVRIIGFDPDPVECARLQQGVDPDRARYVPVALAATAGTRELHVTAEPACSSLYPPDDHAVSTFPELAVAREVGTQTIEVTTLDAWAAAEGIEPDFLKLDVQGAELDVLMGAQRSLDTVRALEIEVEFNPIYRGQPLFGDVDALLRRRGFVLWHLGHLVYYSSSRAMGEQRLPSEQYFDSQPVNFERRGGQLFWGHAYYVHGDVAAGRGDRRQRCADALVAAAIGLNDLAVALLEKNDALA